MGSEMHRGGKLGTLLVARRRTYGGFSGEVVQSRSGGINRQEEAKEEPVK